MIVFPHAKINLGLRITGREQNTKREDTSNGREIPTPGRKNASNGRRERIAGKAANHGYHTIETLLYPVGLYDVLEAIPAPDQQVTFKQSGIPLPDDGKPNLCLRAHNLLKENIRQRTGHHIPPVHIHLLKKIPAGAGLGGGSSDAAFMLLLLNELFRLDLPTKELTSLAGQLGSDCPFFIHKQPMLASGRGNILHPAPGLSLNRYKLLIVIPPVHISTAEAYRLVTPAEPEQSPADLYRKPLKTWQDQMVNDFEDTIFRTHPRLKKIKETLLEKGATYASMSGSGSAIYGFFPYTPPADELRLLLPGCKIEEAPHPVS